MELDKKTFHKIFLGVALIVVLYWALQNASLVLSLLGLTLGLLAPFLVGGCIAFVLNVPMRFFESLFFSSQKASSSKKRPRLYRAISLIITLLAVAGILVIVSFLVIPKLSESFGAISERAPIFLEHVQKLADEAGKQAPAIEEWLQQFSTDFVSLEKKLFAFLENNAGLAIGSVFNFASAVFSGIFSTFLGLVFSIYLLLQKETLSRQVKMILYAFLPEHRACYLIRVGRLANSTFSSFLSGQCLEACILALLFLVVLWILRFPYALMISVLIGVTALIPIFGAMIGCVIGAFFILMTNPIQAFWFVVVFLVVQQIEGNLIYPKVVGNSIGLPSIWVLVAVTVGGSTMGIIGMLIFIPLTSIAYALMRESVYKRLRMRKISIGRINDL